VAERPRPRAVLFDLGGTLLREEVRDLERGLRSFLEGVDLRGAPPPEEAEELAEEIERLREITRDVGDREFQLLAWLGERFGLAAAEASVAELAVWLGAARLSPAPGAKRLLDALSAAEVPLAVVSNTMFGERTLAFELQRHGLLGAIRFVLSSAELGHRKPGGTIFREALSRLGTSAEDTWFVGDSWENDVQGAHAAGLRPVWLARGAAPPAPPPDGALVVQDLEALHRLLRGRAAP